MVNAAEYVRESRSNGPDPWQALSTLGAAGIGASPTVDAWIRVTILVTVIIVVISPLLRRLRVA
ncbi:hypothetical protein [Streptomyces sp. URMC 129]|uniref:hypothetical protein n=1 Tax=Streptomyces sp. URMC 129 TaxID=3423407 RepID=UPI003F1C7CA7